MKHPIAFAAVAAGATLLAGACAADKRMGTHMKADPPVGQSIKCQKCYDEATKTLRFVSKAPKSRGRKVYQTIKRHMCSDCVTGVEIYREDGELRLKCSLCAPEGIACDLCLPPESATQQPLR